MNGRTSYEVIMQYVSPSVRGAMSKVNISDRARLSEIRLRSKRAVSFVYPDKLLFLRSDGTLTKAYSDTACVIASPDMIKAAVDALCRYSVHCFGKELREGYFVIENGVRVGTAGTVTETNGRIMKDFSSLNFRISRSAVGCAEELFSRTRGKSLLICGGVNSGKTTLLRDICRLYGNTVKTVLIDEKNEISSGIGGSHRNDIGANTDVIIGSLRSEGIKSAIRTLSPDIIVCDEIADMSDVKAILGGYGCGVRFIASVHAEKYADLSKRDVTRQLTDAGVFDYAAFLQGSSFPSKIRELRRLGNGS